MGVGAWVLVIGAGVLPTLAIIAWLVDVVRGRPRRTRLDEALARGAAIAGEELRGADPPVRVVVTHERPPAPPRHRPGRARRSHRNDRWGTP
jgi:hypothetical protein